MIILDLETIIWTVHTLKIDTTSFQTLLSLIFFQKTT